MKAVRLFRLLTSLLLCVAAFGAALPADAQMKKVVAWKARLEPADTRAGETAQVVVEATIEAPWHIYSQKKYEGFGPKPTSIELVPNGPLKKVGDVVQPPPHKGIDKGFKIEVEDYPGAVAFGIPVQLSAGKTGEQKAAVKIISQACKDGTCLPPAKDELTLLFTVAEGPARADRTKPVLTAPKQPAGYVPPEGAPKPAVGKVENAAGTTPKPQERGLFAFVLLAISAGFLALLTPCVFPMLPVTVSFFSKQQEAAGKVDLKGPLAYSLGIVFTFTALGLLVSALFGASGIQRLAGNMWVNLSLAIIFVVLAVNLFGGFEILLPSWMLEKASAGSGKGGLIGPLLMGLTFTLTSFTCTVPFVGTLLATTAKGDYFWPALGMLAFSSAFALPFFLLALFPQWLNRLPKAGSWLVTVKAYMGFLELAAALKFLSNVELSLNLPDERAILTQPAFLAVWFAIFIVAACYMMGWLRLPHSDPDQRIGPLRIGIGIATAVLGFYCLTGVNGSSLGWFAGLLPPSTYGMVGGHSKAGSIAWEKDLDAAFARASSENKLLMVNFTGIYCTNCRTMEESVFTRPEVAAKIKEFLPLELYTDRGDAESNKNQAFQLEHFQQVTLPLYAVMTPDRRILGQYALESLPADLSITARQFNEFLESAKSKESAQASR